LHLFNNFHIKNLSEPNLLIEDMGVEFEMAGKLNKAKKAAQAAAKVVGKEAWDLSQHIAGEALGKKLASPVASAAASHMTEAMKADARAKLFSLIRRMPEDAKSNLLRRLREAKAVHLENKMAVLLFRATEAERKLEDKILALKHLNDLDDANFSERIDLLDHDFIVQGTQRALHVTGQYAKKADDNVASVLSHIRHRLRGGKRRNS